MANRSPSIAAIGVISRKNSPLHISLFPSTGEGSESPRDPLKFSFMLNSCLDAFDARVASKTITQDLGLLHALDERIALYGWLTNTGVKFIVAVDMQGRVAPSPEAAKLAMLGLRNADLFPAFQALQSAYIRLLNNPFYVPADSPQDIMAPPRPTEIKSPRFVREVVRIGKTWQPGMSSM